MLTNQLYHYTIGSKFSAIDESGVLLRTPLKPDRQEKSVVWLSSNANFENSARKIAYNPRTNQQYLMSAEDMITLAGALVRYVFEGSDINARTWNDARREVGMSRKRRDLLLERANLVISNPDDWWVTFSAIELTKAIRVEICTEITTDGKLVWRKMESANVNTKNVIVSMTVEELNKTTSFDIDKTWRQAR